MNDKIKNTAEEVGLVTFMRVQRLGSTGAIEEMEVEGQRQLVESSQLPVKMLGDGDRGALEAMGIEFIGTTEGDELFQDVRLPENLSIQATDHSMWSELVGSDGVVVAGIFYKAAFYDRQAHLRVVPESERE